MIQALYVPAHPARAPHSGAVIVAAQLLRALDVTAGVRS
jgi:hypothetical protein